jgi:rubrerythrin
MSETGIISQEYENTAELFRAINQSVIVLKKKHFNLTGAAQVTSGDLSEARKLLTDLLRQLIEKLEHEPSVLMTEDTSLQVPPFFIKRLQERHSGEMQWYLKDLRELLQALEEGRPLTGNLITYLDELCGQLDAETTAIHRRLWRK